MTAKANKAEKAKKAEDAVEAARRKRERLRNGLSWLAAASMLIAAGVLLVWHIVHEQKLVPQTTVTLAGQAFHVEIADTPEEQTMGLMYRTELDADRGMLFVFESEQTRVFWMKNTFIPLDIVFMDAERRVLNVETLAAESERRAYSDGLAKYVLEVPAGTAKRLGVTAGAVAEFALGDETAAEETSMTTEEDVGPMMRGTTTQAASAATTSGPTTTQAGK